MGNKTVSVVTTLVSSPMLKRMRRGLDFKNSFLWRTSLPSVRRVYYGYYMPLLCWYAGLSDRKNIRRTGKKAVPPPSLRYRVSGKPGIELFLNVGKIIANEIESSLSKLGKDLNSFQNVLDFGCGCGRTLIWYDNRKPKFYGTDTDAHAINWCRKNLPFGEFNVNEAFQPLKYRVTCLTLFIQYRCLRI